MKERNPSIPQYWMGDFVGIMEEGNRLLSTPRDDSIFASHEGCAFPARYPSRKSGSPNVEASQEIVRDAKQVADDAKQGRFVAAAVFRALQGSWVMQLSPPGPDAPAVQTGVAAFHPRFPTARGFDSEYLYTEALASQGHEAARPILVWRYSAVLEQVSVWRVAKDTKAAEGLLCTLAVQPPRATAAPAERRWVLSGSDLATDPPVLRAECRFQGVCLAEFEIRGPGLSASRRVYRR